MGKFEKTLNGEGRLPIGGRNEIRSMDRQDLGIQPFRYSSSRKFALTDSCLSNRSTCRLLFRTSRMRENAYCEDKGSGPVYILISGLTEF